MNPQLIKCFFGAPFSNALEVVDGKVLGIAQNLQEKWGVVYEALRQECAEVWSSHVAEDFGRNIHEEEIVQRDLRWLAECDVFVALLSLDENGHPYRSDGLSMECGGALAMKKPTVLIIEEPLNEKRSYFLANLYRQSHIIVLPWVELRRNPRYNIREALDKLGFGFNTNMEVQRREVTDVDEVIQACESQKKPHGVIVNGIHLTVMPGVFSPRFSHSSDFIISHLEIPRNAKVLDLGSGTGVLGIYALLAGAASLVSVDINSAAVENTKENLRQHKLSDRAQVLLGDCYENIAGAFDVIIFNAPFWNRKARNDLERAVFDEDYAFLRRALAGAARLLATDGTMYLCFSDQGDSALVLNLIYESKLGIDGQWLQKARREQGHIRILWRLSKTSQTAKRK